MHLLLAEDRILQYIGAQFDLNVLLKIMVQAYLYDGYWEDIGTIKAFYNANLGITKKPLLDFSFYDGSSLIFTQPPYCLLLRCLMLMSHTVLLVKAEGAVIEDSLLMGADYYETDADRELLAAKGRVPIGNWQRAVQGAPSYSFSMYIQITIDYVHMHAYKIATQQDSHFASNALGSLSQKVVVFCNIGTLADLGTLEDLGSIRSEVIYSKKGTKRSEPEHEHPSRFIFEKSDTY
ncbi:glucose-1-phosphate adenylyltransferase small subunit, chloroplastic/amyloplastic [Tanacetum coccineum]